MLCKRNNVHWSLSGLSIGAIYRGETIYICKKKWFDQNCRHVKREANRADRYANSNPHSKFLRDQHFLRKKEYRAIKRTKNEKFLYEMNQKINECGEVNWPALKRLSDQYKDEEPFDIYDLILFHKFFNDLYNRKCGSEIHSKDDVTSTPLSNNSQLTKELVNELNRDFTLQEIRWSDIQRNVKKLCLGINSQNG